MLNDFITHQYIKIVNFIKIIKFVGFLNWDIDLGLYGLWENGGNLTVSSHVDFYSYSLFVQWIFLFIVLDLFKYGQLRMRNKHF